MIEDFKIEIENPDTAKLKEAVYTRIHYGNVLVGKKKAQSSYSFRVIEYKSNELFNIELQYFENSPSFDCKKEILEKLKLNG